VACLAVAVGLGWLCGGVADLRPVASQYMNADERKFPNKLEMKKKKTEQ